MSFTFNLQRDWMVLFCGLKIETLVTLKITNISDHKYKHLGTC